MTYRIQGLDPAPFRSLYGASDDELARHDAVRVTADDRPGFPCRVTLEDAEVGESVLLLPCRLARSGPFGFTYAIFIREGAQEARQLVDAVPPVFGCRVLSLRGFDENDRVAAATLAQPGEADDAIRAMFDDRAVAYIDVHNAVAGCFAARVERS